MADTPRNKGRDSRAASAAIEAYFKAAPVTVPIYAVLVAAAVGSLVVLAVGSNPIEAYGALIRGAVGSPDAIARTLARSTPFIAAALAVALGFKAGLFNIGAEGQLAMGALAGAWVGAFAFLGGLPSILVIPIVIGAGALGGAAWGFIPGFLKARTGAHEVIVTIMLNSIAARLVEWVVTSRHPVILLDTTATSPHTVPVVESARLPHLVPGVALHIGFIGVLVLCGVIWFLLQRTTLGFEVRTVGTNPNAARYAGMSVAITTVWVMAASGALAGMGGAGEIAGSTNAYLTPGLLAGIGFDAIAIALLARANPFAIIPAALLWGALLTGAPLMQLQANLSLDLVRIVQALIILFVAADAIIRTMFRIRRPRGEIEEDEGAAVFSQGWGS